MESTSFWNPESTVLESGIQYPGSGIHSMESRIQDCPGFPYMGRLFLFVLFKNIGERLSETSESQREARLLSPPLPLALAVRKSPAVFVFYHARSTDFEENRGSVNRLNIVRICINALKTRRRN